MATSVFENEKKFREGKKFEIKETKGEKIRNILNQGKKEESPRTRRRQAPNPPRRVPGEQKEMIPLRPEGITFMAKGGRAGFKSGSKGCKLAMRGKGRAYGKNS